MPPRNPFDDVLNRRLADSIPLGESLDARADYSTPILSSYLSHLRVGQFCFWMTLALGLSILALPVSNVIQLTASKQMTWTDACCVVTLMENLVRSFPEMDEPTTPVGVENCSYSISLGFNYDSVAVSHSASPNPALSQTRDSWTVLIDLGPESVGQRYSHRAVRHRKPLTFSGYRLYSSNLQTNGYVELEES